MQHRRLYSISMSR